MDLMNLAIEGYRLLVGFALLIAALIILKKSFSEPFVDELNKPDYMIKVHGKKQWLELF